MIRNYLKIAFRNLLRNKSYTFINIAGLAVGIAACLVIFLIINFELSFDSFHSKRDKIQRVVSEFTTTDGKSLSSGVPFTTSQNFKVDFPQLEKVATLMEADDNITVLGDATNKAGKKFKERGNVFYAEPAFFEIFDFPLLSGDPKTALSEPYSALVTQEVAEKYFGTWQEAIGKYIKNDNRDVLKITGILKNVPTNSDFPLKVVIPYEVLKKNNPGMFKDEISVASAHNVFVVLPNNQSPEQFTALLAAYAKKHKPAEYAKEVLVLQSFKEMHFDSELDTPSHHSFSKELIWSLGLIGAFLLLVACVNFINLATAQAINRSKEVGVRKVLGSNRSDLIGQFFGETTLITITAVIIAIILAQLILPALNQLLNLQVSFNLLEDPKIGLFLVSITLSTILLSGFYPAIILSGFNPIMALKSKITAKNIGGVSLRRGLVVMQFTIAQVLIIGVLVVVSQMKHFQNASLGFDKDAIINVNIPNDSLSQTKYNAVKNQLLQQSGIKQVSLSFTSPMSNRGWNSDFKFDNSTKNTEFAARFQMADVDYFKLYNLKFVAGRPYLAGDTIREFVVNETLIKKFGITNPQDAIGKEINFWDGRMKAKIVGVVKDYHAVSLHQKIPPIVMGTRKENYSTINIKLQSNNAKETLASIEKIWTTSFPDYIYEFDFLDQGIARAYEQERQLSRLYEIFAAIAIFISCLGLYGLVSFMAIQRTKEVGIRKTLGASVGHIVYLFSKEFTLLIGVAFLIAAPIGYYFMTNWLKRFEFKIELGVGIFLMAILISIVIAWLTVSYQAIKAALVNPIKSLKTE